MFSRAHGRDVASFPWQPSVGPYCERPSSPLSAANTACGLPKTIWTKRNIKSAASPNGMAEHIHGGNGVAYRPWFGSLAEPGNIRHHPGDRGTERGADRAYRGQGGDGTAMFVAPPR